MLWGGRLLLKIRLRNPDEQQYQDSAEMLKYPSVNIKFL